MRAAARRLGPSLGARAASSSPAASAGVSYTKAGGDAGALPGDAPHWLAELGGRPPSAFELRRKLEAGETLAEDEARAARLFKLEARSRIRGRNENKAKK